MRIDSLIRQLVYWGVWLIIPFLWEIVTGIASAVVVGMKYLKKHTRQVDFLPYVSILVPVYNSQQTLEGCLASICRQHYPLEKLEVFLIDNGSTDSSFDVFVRFQSEHSQMKMWWYNSEQGKSKALNMGIFASTGKYIINIDSDGTLDKKAIRNIVTRFENDGGISGMTGVVLINPEKINETGNIYSKALKICELFEYNESFLVGRNFQSVFNSLYTMAGAFSCFRREAVIGTQMYNSETVGEDAHMTRQVKDFNGGRVVLCEDAFFYTDPVDNLDKLYIQRQRWQRAELEVASLFVRKHLGGVWSFLTKPAMRKLVSDHTLSFPRLMWMFAMVYLYFINYPLNLLVGANLLLYLAYAFNSLLYTAVSSLYLKKQPKMRRYVLKHWYICFILPVYRFVVYWVRIAGIINSLTSESRWRTRSLSEEMNIVREGVRRQAGSKLGFLEKIREFVNH